MTTVYDLYGVTGQDLEEARLVVETALDVSLSLHESGFHGGKYFRKGDVGSEHFILQRNFDSFEGEWAEPKHRTATFLLYVNETTRSGKLRRQLEATSAISHLRSDLFD